MTMTDDQIKHMVEGMPCRPNPETQAAESKVAKVLRESIERVRPTVLAEREGETITGEVMDMILKGSECPCCYGKGRIPEEAPNATVAYLIGLTRSPVESVPVSALRELEEKWMTRDADKGIAQPIAAAIRRECADEMRTLWNHPQREIKPRIPVGPELETKLKDVAKDARALNLKWGRHDGRGEYHMEWHAPCGCAYHPEPKPHVHPCIRHSEIEPCLKK